jgi:hypothetical protein
VCAGEYPANALIAPTRATVLRQLEYGPAKMRD